MVEVRKKSCLPRSGLQSAADMRRFERLTKKVARLEERSRKNAAALLLAKTH